jgi:hypothetical protein
LAADSVVAAGLAGVAVFAADFNGFDAALCDGASLAFLVADLRAAGLSVVREPVPVFAAVFVRIFPGDADLGDFLRDFLDIRLPFVAFGGSIMGRLRDLPGPSESRLWLGKSAGPGVWLQGIRHVPEASLDSFSPGADDGQLD